MDIFLGWFVVAIPFLVTVGATVITLKLPHERDYWKFVWGAIGVGLLFSAVTYWQQYRSAKEAVTAQQGAINETAQKTARETTDNVTRAVSSQYKQIIDSLNSQIGDLKGQLASQGKKVDAIGASPFVSGKAPVKVEVENLGAENATPSHQGHLTVTQKSDVSTRADAPYLTLVTVQSDIEFPTLMLVVTCDHDLVSARGGVAGEMNGGSGIVRGHPNEVTLQYSAASPGLTPSNPIHFRIFTTQPVQCTQATTF